MTQQAEPNFGLKVCVWSPKLTQSKWQMWVNTGFDEWIKPEENIYWTFIYFFLLFFLNVLLDWRQAIDIF